MLHDTFTWLARRGHACTAMNLVHAPEQAEYDLDHVHVLDLPSDERVRAEWDAADIVVTHLDLSAIAQRISRARKKPLAHIVHNHQQLRYHRVLNAALLIYNSEHLQAAYRDQASPVLHPPVPPRYQTLRGDAVTLVNLNRAKGSAMLYHLASVMPEQRFLGVVGAYGAQDYPPRRLENLRLVAGVSDARRIYRQTRVLLMPSAYESYGRCAVEAAWSGIPTIHADLPGMAEGIGSGGIAAPDAECYESALRCLLSKPAEYAYHSRLAKRRAKLLWERSEQELVVVEQRLIAAAS